MLWHPPFFWESIKKVFWQIIIADYFPPYLGTHIISKSPQKRPPLTLKMPPKGTGTGIGSAARKVKRKVKGTMINVFIVNKLLDHGIVTIGGIDVFCYLLLPS